MPKAEDLTGQIHGKLFVIKRAGSYFSRSGSSSPMWITLCLLCGETRLISTQHLRQLKVKACKSCGSPEGRKTRKDSLSIEFQTVMDLINDDRE